MRLIHTADWHLGRTLHGVDLGEHQAAFCDFLVELVQERAADAVVIAGDVFDRAVPPVEAVTLFAHTLERLSQHADVVVTSGNHDSAIRLGFTSRLLRDRLHVRTATADVGTPVLLGDLAVYPLPYLDPDEARHVLAPGADPLPRSHTAVLSAAMDRVRSDAAGRSGLATVVAAHAFVTGGAESESERDIRVGGIGNVPAGVFAGVDYAALGHLHGPQRLSDHVRYAGSPLAYSFSEARHAKSVAVVELGSGVPVVELVSAPVPRRMSILRGELEEVLAGEASEDWLQVTITDPIRPEHMFAQLKQHFPHLLEVRYEPAGDRAAGPLPVVRAGADPLQIATGFVEYVTGSEPTPAEMTVFQNAFEHARARL